MEDIHDFETFYAVKIEPFLEEIESKDLNQKIWGRLSILGIVIFIICLIGIAENEFKSVATFVAIFCFPLMIYSIYQHYVSNNTYINTFQQKVIKQIIDFLNLGLEFKNDFLVELGFLFDNTSELNVRSWAVVCAVRSMPATRK